jgi:hypothetical protein
VEGVVSRSGVRYVPTYLIACRMDEEIRAHILLAFWDFFSRLVDESVSQGDASDREVHGLNFR